MKIIKPILFTLTGALALASAGSMAQTDTEMEVITVTYRAPIDYALYVYNTEMSAIHSLEVEQGIVELARNQSLEAISNMAQLTQGSLAELADNKDIITVGLSQAAE